MLPVYWAAFGFFTFVPIFCGLTFISTMIVSGNGGSARRRH